MSLALVNFSLLHVLFYQRFRCVHTLICPVRFPYLLNHFLLPVLISARELLLIELKYNNVSTAICLFIFFIHRFFLAVGVEFNEGLLFSKYMGRGYFIFVLLVGADFWLLAGGIRLHKGGILFYFNHECTSNDEWGPGS